MLDEHPVPQANAAQMDGLIACHEAAALDAHPWRAWSNGFSRLGIRVAARVRRRQVFWGKSAPTHVGGYFMSSPPWFMTCSIFGEHRICEREDGEGNGEAGWDEWESFCFHSSCFLSR